MKSGTKKLRSVFIALEASTQANSAINYVKHFEDCALKPQKARIFVQRCWSIQ